MSPQILQFLHSNPKYSLKHNIYIYPYRDVRVIIDQIKKIIKGKKNDTPSKVLSLKLLNACVIQSGSNPEVLKYVEKKMIRKFLVYARFKKELVDLEKGALLFGKQCNNRAAADFQKLVLLYIKTWGNKYKVYGGSEQVTEIWQLYQQLLKEKVHFPSEESVIGSLCSDYYQDVSKSVNSTLLSSNMSQSFQTNVQPQVNAQNRQLQIASEIKKNYKKLAEHESTAKLVEEVLQTTNGQIDESFLVELRQQLQDGKDFTEKYLKNLMECTLEIKDKEQKINKIIGIINEIGTQLEKILVIRPYSPRSIQVMKNKQIEETKNEKSPQQVNQQEEDEQMNYPQPQSSRNTRKPTRNVQRFDNDEELKNDIVDPQYNKDIFKTNFMDNSVSQSIDFSQSNKQGEQVFDFGLIKKKMEQSHNEQKQLKVEVPKKKEEIQVKIQEKPQIQDKINEKPQAKVKEKHQIPVKKEEKIVNNEAKQMQNNQFGVIIKSHDKRPVIDQSSPHSEISSEMEDVFEDTSNEKKDFKMPTINQPHDKQHSITNSQPHKIESQDKSAFKSQSKDTIIMSNPFKWDDKSEVKEDNHSAFNFDFPKSQPVNEKASFDFGASCQKSDSKVYSQKQDELQLKVDQLLEKNDQLQAQNKDLSKQLLKQNDKVSILSKEYEKEKSLMNKEIVELKKQVKSLKKFEFLYEEERFKQKEVQNEVGIVNEKYELLKKIVDGQNEKVSKREREIEKLKEELKQSKENEQKQIQTEIKLSQLVQINNQRESQLLKQIDDQSKQEKDLKSKLEIALKRQVANISSEKQFKIVKIDQMQLKKPITAFDQRSEEQKEAMISNRQMIQSPQKQMNSLYKSTNSEIDLEERFCNKPPSDDSDEQSDAEEKWKQAKAQYLQGKNKTPGEDKQQRKQAFEYQQMIGSGNKETPQNKDIDKNNKKQEEESHISEFWDFNNKDEDAKLRLSESSKYSNVSPEPKGFSLSWGDDEQPKKEDPVQIRKSSALSNKGDENYVSQSAVTPRKTIIEDIFSLFAGGSKEQSRAPSGQKEIQIQIPKEQDEKKEVVGASPFSFFTNLFTPKNDESKGSEQVVNQFDENTHKISATTEEINDLLNLPSKDGKQEAEKPRFSIIYKAKSIEDEEVKVEQKKEVVSNDIDFSIFDIKKEEDKKVEVKQVEEVKVNQIEEIKENKVELQIVKQESNDLLTFDEPETKSEYNTQIIKMDHRILEIKEEQKEIQKYPEQNQIAPQIKQDHHENVQISPDVMRRQLMSESKLSFISSGDKSVPSSDEKQVMNLFSQAERTSEIMPKFQPLSRQSAVSIQVQNHQVADLSIPQFVQNKSQEELKQRPRGNSMSIINNQIQSLVPIQNIQQQQLFRQQTIPIQQQYNGQQYQPIMQQQVQNPFIGNQNHQYNQSQYNTQQIQQYTHIKNEDIHINQQQFSTQNTQQFHQNQQLDQQKLDPKQSLSMLLLGQFRKSLLQNESLLYEDNNLLIGSKIEYEQNNIVIIKLAFRVKNMQLQSIDNISLKQMMPPIGYEVIQNREFIQQIFKQQQELISFKIKVDTFQMGIPLYSLNYKLIDIPTIPNIPIRLPIVLMKFCQGIPNLDSSTFIRVWNEEFGIETEAKTSFNVDFNQCRSLSQLKQVLQFGRGAMSFVDGADVQKNVVCGATQFVVQNQYSALIKIAITGNGQGCEIIGRSNDKFGNEFGKFAKFIISNILEMIALKVV